jgi:hypothetical protein
MNWFQFQKENKQDVFNVPDFSELSRSSTRYEDSNSWKMRLSRKRQVVGMDDGITRNMGS